MSSLLLTLLNFAKFELAVNISLKEVSGNDKTLITLNGDDQVTTSDLSVGNAPFCQQSPPTNKHLCAPRSQKNFYD